MTDEERQLREALAANGWSVTKTAIALDKSRQTIWRWMKKYGIELARVPVDKAA